MTRVPSGIGTSVSQRPSVSLVCRIGKAWLLKITIGFIEPVKIIGTDISNKFTIGETIIGSSSEAKASLGTRVQTSDQQLTNDPAAKNVVIETIADGIIDFSEDNPFSEDI